MRELPTINEPVPVLDLAPEEIEALAREVRALAEERDAVILAHNYQVPEVQDVADYTGDSLGLSRQAAAADASTIVFCGVHFMAETAAILSPEKTVLIPDLDAGCSLADSITAERAAQLEVRHSPERGRRHVRQHLGRGEGGDRLLLHLLQRGQGRRAHPPRARAPAPRSSSAPTSGWAPTSSGDRPSEDARLAGRVPRPRRDPPRRHRPPSEPPTPTPSSSSTPSAAASPR